MLDLLIRDAQVLDGTGAPAVHTDVGVNNGRISAVGKLAGSAAGRTVNAEGHVLAPGFIDIHTHDDFNLPINPGAGGKVLQGVTTLVAGNCGYSPAPIRGGEDDAFMKMRGALASDVEWNWNTFAEFLHALPPLTPNLCQLVGHITVRAKVMGMEERPPSELELRAMQAEVAEAMDAGAIGFSSGLCFVPTTRSTTEEVAALARIAAERGGLYATHTRWGDVFESTQEAVTISRLSGAPVQVSHLKIAHSKHWGRTTELLHILEQARDEGLDVLCDQYPYLAGSSPIRNRLPAWVEDGGVDALCARLRDAETRATIRREIDGAIKGGQHILTGWDKLAVAYSLKMPEFNGLNFEQIGQRMGKAPVDAYFEVILADHGGTQGIDFVMDEDDVRAIMKHPLTTIGSDGLFRGVDPQPYPGKPHPRHFGTFPRVLGHYCRELGLFGLPEAVRKMTSASAAMLGLKDRGRIAPGLAADLVLFDPEAIIDTSTYTEPQQYPVGVRLVAINGVVVAEDGRMTGTTPGRKLRPQR